MHIDDADLTNRQLCALVTNLTMRLALTARQLGGMSEDDAEAFALGMLAGAAASVTRAPVGVPELVE